MAAKSQRARLFISKNAIGAYCGQDYPHFVTPSDLEEKLIHILAVASEFIVVTWCHEKKCYDSRGKAHKSFCVQR